MRATGTEGTFGVAHIAAPAARLPAWHDDGGPDAGPPCRSIRAAPPSHQAGTPRMAGYLAGARQRIEPSEVSVPVHSTVSAVGYASQTFLPLKSVMDW